MTALCEFRTFPCLSILILGSALHFFVVIQNFIKKSVFEVSRDQNMSQKQDHMCNLALKDKATGKTRGTAPSGDRITQWSSISLLIIVKLFLCE